jgi:hypothetical protein
MPPQPGRVGIGMFFEFPNETTTKSPGKRLISIRREKKSGHVAKNPAIFGCRFARIFLICLVRRRFLQNSRL